MTEQKTDTCGATVDLEGGRTLVCVLHLADDGGPHDGPTHEDAAGERWGDPTLPAVHHRDPDGP